MFKPLSLFLGLRYVRSRHGNGFSSFISASSTLEQCKKLLEMQLYKCAHCLCDLSCKQGTAGNYSYTRASLDRIDTTITGYGNGNAQWLCVSCNKGKCTMPDQIHKEKFSKLRDHIKYLEALLKEHNIST